MSKNPSATPTTTKAKKGRPKKTSVTVTPVAAIVDVAEPINPPTCTKERKCNCKDKNSPSVLEAARHFVSCLIEAIKRVL